MKRPTLLVALAIVALAPLSAGAATLGNDFNILNNKNIFSKNRGISHPIGPGIGVGNPRNHTQRVYTPILIGAMLEDDGYVAFIVDPRSRDITSVRPGDELPMNAGTLKVVTLDYVITDPGGGKPPTRVTIGQNILGGLPEYPDASDDDSADNPDAAGPSTQPGGAATGTAGVKPADSSTAAPSDGSVDSIAERLRKRRLQQLGK